MENIFKIKISVQVLISLEFAAVWDHWEKYSNCITKGLNNFIMINNFVSYAM